MNHNSKHGCSRCTVVGEYSHTSNTTVFKSLRPLRTDADFRSGVYFGSHQAHISPILSIKGVDIIQDFIVADSLHLFDHGITDKLLTGFINGKLGNIESKWCVAQINMVSEYLISMKPPCEIRELRAVRDLKSIAKWKGIEFHNFALYLGIVVLNGNLPDYIYNHFLLYFCAYTIISSKEHLLRLTLVADSCMNLFIERFKEIYGVHHFTSNVHYLHHVMEDVRRFGPINTFSTYPFEGYLFTIKKLLRSGNLPLSQAANRLMEAEYMNSDFNSIRKDFYPILVTPSSDQVDHLNKLIPVKYDLYSVVKFEKFKINCAKDEDRYVLTIDQKILEIAYFVLFDGQTKMYGQTISDAQNYFDLPIQSSEMLIYSSENLTKNPPDFFEIDHIMCKLFKLKRNKNYMYKKDTENLKNEYVFLPLLNTFAETEN